MFSRRSNFVQHMNYKHVRMQSEELMNKRELKIHKRLSSRLAAVSDDDNDDDDDENDRMSHFSPDEVEFHMQLKESLKKYEENQKEEVKGDQKNQDDDVKSIHGYIKDLIANSPESKESQSKSCKHLMNKF